MYYSNITNEELQYFHNLTVPNFSIKLTDVLTSDLFKKETIITDTIYKIYPLFYCKEITSTNPDDRVLENKCIICKKESTETYLTFRSDDGDVQDYQSFATYYDIGDALTTEQYNNIVSLLRSSTIHSDTIKIMEEYTGEYGKYLFDIADTTVLDDGIIITDETITAEPRVKLTNNVFHYATYTLKLKVLHYTGAKIEDTDTTDYKVIETLTITLTPNEWVDIPVSTLDEDYIILLDGVVEITHNKPVIPDWIRSIEVSANPDIIQTGDTTDIYANCYDNGGIPVGAGHIVHFFEKLEPTITMSASSDIIQTSDNLELYATVKDEDGSLAKGVKTHFYAKPNSNGVLINNPTEYSKAASGLKGLFELTGLGEKWELSCDFKADRESRFMIGSKDDFTGNPNNSIFVGSPNGTNKMYYGYRDTTTHATDVTSVDPTSYSHMKIKRNNGSFTFTVNSNNYTLSNVTVLDNVTEFIIGLVAWGSTGTVYVKNVKLIVDEEE